MVTNTPTISGSLPRRAARKRSRSRTYSSEKQQRRQRPKEVHRAIKERFDALGDCEDQIAHLRTGMHKPLDHASVPNEGRHHNKESGDHSRDHEQHHRATSAIPCGKDSHQRHDHNEIGRTKARSDSGKHTTPRVPSCQRAVQGKQYERERPNIVECFGRVLPKGWREGEGNQQQVRMMRPATNKVVPRGYGKQRCSKRRNVR